MPWWAWIVILLAALYPLHRLFLWMESKDWVYYRRKPKTGVIGAALAIENVANPYAEQARAEIVAENEDDGDDDDDRPLSDRVATRAED